MSSDLLLAVLAGDVDLAHGVGTLRDLVLELDVAREAPAFLAHEGEESGERRVARAEGEILLPMRLARRQNQ